MPQQPSLRERLWGKTKPLREKLATVWNETADERETAKNVGIKALEVASGRIVPYTIGRYVTDKLPQETPEEIAAREAEVNKKEIAGMKEYHDRMGFESDEYGNRTTAKPGVDTRAIELGVSPSHIAMKTAGMSDYLKKTQFEYGLPKAEAKEPEPKIDKNNNATTTDKLPLERLVFQEGDYMPYIKDESNKDGFVELKNVVFNPPETKRIKRLVLTNKDTGALVAEITDPKKLELANTIKRVSDAVAPEWTSYLLRLAQREGIYEAKQRNYIFNKTRPVKQPDGSYKEIHYSSNDPADADKYGGLWSTDRGVFQINDAAFPGIPDEVADDPVKATLWAISLINAGKQERWYADESTKNTAIEIEEED